MKKFENFQAASRIAIDIINQTKEQYYDMFVQLSKTIEQNWL